MTSRIYYARVCPLAFFFFPPSAGTSDLPLYSSSRLHTSLTHLSTRLEPYLDSPILNRITSTFCIPLQYDCVVDTVVCILSLQNHKASKPLAWYISKFIAVSR